MIKDCVCVFIQKFMSIGKRNSFETRKERKTERERKRLMVANKIVAAAVAVFCFPPIAPNTSHHQNAHSHAQKIGNNNKTQSTTNPTITYLPSKTTNFLRSPTRQHKRHEDKHGRSTCMVKHNNNKNTQAFVKLAPLLLLLKQITHAPQEHLSKRLCAEN
jgi:hypothetical protein